MRLPKRPPVKIDITHPAGQSQLNELLRQLYSRIAELEEIIEFNRNQVESELQTKQPVGTMLEKIYTISEEVIKDNNDKFVYVEV